MSNLLNKLPDEVVSPQKKSSYRRVIVISLIIIIVFGLLLLIPSGLQTKWLTNGQQQSKAGHFTFLDAIFTAVSAFTNTGYSITQLSHQFKLVGLMFIVILMQIGALMIFSVKVMIFIAIYSKINKQRKIVVSSKSLNQKMNEMNIFRMVRMMFVFLILIQVVATLVFAIYFSCAHVNNQIYNTVHHQFGNAIWHSYFLVTSALTGTGFDLFGRVGPTGYSSLALFSHNGFILLSIAFLIICGGIGFPIYYGAWQKIKNIYYAKPVITKRWLQTFRWSTYSYLIITFVGFICLLAVLMRSRELNGLNSTERIINIFFLTVSSRNAGFTTFNISGSTVKVFLFLLMWIGVSPLALGGGIRSTTFLIIIIGIYGFITKQKKQVKVFRHAISNETIARCNNIFILSWVLIFVYMLFYFTCHFSVASEAGIGENGIDALFIAGSFFGTTGMGGGVVMRVTWYTVLVNAMIMLIGQMTILNFIYCLQSRKENKKNMYFTKEIYVY